MTLMGIEGIYSAYRIQADSLPEGFFRYELTSGKDSRFAFVHTGRTSRHAGDFISKTPLDLQEKDRYPLSADDWRIDEGCTFDFEAFWGHKLSINKQISNAEYKRDMAMGKTPGGRDVHLSETITQESMIL